MTLVKVCGLTTPEAVDAAVEAGADYLGFNLYPRSPRALTHSRAASLVEHARGRARTVVLLVDPDDALVDVAAALAPDLIQLHGRETPARAETVRRRTGRRLIKALPVATAEDLAAAREYSVDHLMFDAKPPPGADRPGGHGTTFDWSILSSRPDPGLEPGGEPGPPGPGVRQAAGTLSREVPGRPMAARDDGALEGLWFLAGGLNPGNVADAIRATAAPVVDVCSGVEARPGVMDPASIAAFVRAAKAA